MWCPEVRRASPCAATSKPLPCQTRIRLVVGMSVVEITFKYLKYISSAQPRGRTITLYSTTSFLDHGFHLNTTISSSIYVCSIVSESFHRSNSYACSHEAPPSQYQVILPSCLNDHTISSMGQPVWGIADIYVGSVVHESSPNIYTYVVYIERLTLSPASTSSICKSVLHSM